MNTENAYWTLARLGAVDTYRVGFLRDLHVLWADARLGITTWSYAIRTLLRRVSRSWRRRSYWVGWLAEPRQLPDGLSRCGSGWTRVRSLRSLARLADQH